MLTIHARWKPEPPLPCWHFPGPGTLWGADLGTHKIAGALEVNRWVRSSRLGQVTLLWPLRAVQGPRKPAGPEELVPLGTPQDWALQDPSSSRCFQKGQDPPSWEINPPSHPAQLSTTGRGPSPSAAPLRQLYAPTDAPMGLGRGARRQHSPFRSHPHACARGTDSALQQASEGRNDISRDTDLRQREVTAGDRLLPAVFPERPPGNFSSGS